jgi:hypothetical protein
MYTERDDDELFGAGYTSRAGSEKRSEHGFGELSANTSLD